MHDHLVGLMTVTGEVDLACLAANFNLGQLSHMTHYEEGQLGEVRLRICCASCLPTVANR